MRKAQRKLVYRRMGILALAIAVPAMAAPATQSARENVQVHFAPSDVPQQQIELFEPAAELVVPAEPLADLPALQPATNLLADLNVGPAAQPFAIGGNLSDRASAQRCMTMAVYYEAASESVSGQRAVAQVVMNRVRHSSYPNNICGVVFQGSERSTGCQFSFTCDGSLSRVPERQSWLRADRVARAALGGFVYQPVGLATHYHTLAVNPYWASSLQAVTQVGAHQFYRWRGAAGLPAAFHAQYRGGEILPSQSSPRAYASASYTASAPAPLNDVAAQVATLAGAALTSLPTQTTAIRPADRSGDTPGAQPVDALPQAGSALSQYQQSGQWLRQP